MTTAIIVSNGQVLSLKVDKVTTCTDNDRMDLYIKGATVSISSNNAVILNQNEMDDNTYNQMVKSIESALVSDEGTITHYNPENKKIVRNKKLIK